MADIYKVLYDDHSRIKRLFDRLHLRPSDHMLAQQICNEIDIHSAIEEELVYPAVADQLDERVAERGETDHQKIEELVGSIQELEPGDPAMQSLMAKLKKAVERHVAWEEREMFPLMKRGLKSPVSLGARAFAMRQEMMGQNPAPPAVRAQIVNTGWYTGSVPNAGW